jgi:hypothetical protein
MTAVNGSRIRRLLGVATLIGLVGSMIGLSAASAQAKAPSPVSIVAAPGDRPGFGGVWQASGAISDSGTFVRTGLHLSESPEHSPVVGAFQVELEFSGSQGTFTLRDELMFSPSGLTGSWQVVSGTGAYAGASGHGTSTFDFSASTTLFTGVLSLRS